MRRRAAVDALLILLATVGASLLGTNSHERLLAGLAMLSLGILLFVLRRSRDVSKLLEAGRWRDEALAGRGLSLAQWHAGVPLAEWGNRSADEPVSNEKACGSHERKPQLEFSAKDHDRDAAEMPEISDSRDDAR